MTKVGYDRRRRDLRVRVDRRRTEIDVVEHVIQGVRKPYLRGTAAARAPLRRVDT
jgi:hypothetical protein